MRALFKIELIGDNIRREARNIVNDLTPAVGRAAAEAFMGKDPSRPWVARIDGLDPRYGLARTFVHGTRDYSRANSVGSRGVWECFALEPGLYEVFHRVSWHRARRYFIRVTEDGSYHEISREEVEACLRSATSASAS